LCLPLLCYVIESTLPSRFATRRSAVRSRSAPPILDNVVPGIWRDVGQDFSQIFSVTKFKGDGVHPNRHSLRNFQIMDDDSSQDYLQRSCSVMKLSYRLRWHTANPGSGAQIRRDIQTTILKLMTRPLDEMWVVANCVQLLFRDTQGART